MRIEKIIWDEDFIFGIGIIDYQHKRIIDLINEIIDLMNDKESIEDILFFVDELFGYVLSHFKTEERILKMLNYPHYNEHKSIHQCYINKIQKLYNLGDIKDENSIYQFVIFLKEWSFNHILNEDKEYKEHIHSKGYK
jgi:hemerythrin